MDDVIQAATPVQVGIVQNIKLMHDGAYIKFVVVLPNGHEVEMSRDLAEVARYPWLREGKPD